MKSVLYCASAQYNDYYLYAKLSMYCFRVHNSHVLVIRTHIFHCLSRNNIRFTFNKYTTLLMFIDVKLYLLEILEYKDKFY